MAKYKRRGITVDAFQWTGYDEKTIPKWFKAAEKKASDQPGACRVISNDIIKVLTPAGIVQAHKGDYIMRSENGEIYPCNEKLFNFLHDIVPDPLA